MRTDAGTPAATLRVDDLRPGDVFDTAMPDEPRACFVAQVDHPAFLGLRLVIWRISGGRWSHDALAPRQDLGAPVERGGDTRCRAAVLGQGEWGGREGTAPTVDLRPNDPTEARSGSRGATSR